ncbi:MAG TPA: pilin [Candidatus Paceibacterota bacterium]
MNTLTKKIGLGGLLYFAPLLALAQTGGLGDFIATISELLNAIIPLIIGIAFIYFLYGVFNYIIKTGPEEKAKNRDVIIYGIIGLAVMIAAWGLVNVLVNTFGLDTSESSIDLPGIPS